MASSKSRKNSRKNAEKGTISKYLGAAFSKPALMFVNDIVHENVTKYIPIDQTITNDNFTPEAIKLLRTIAEDRNLSPGETIRFTDEDYDNYGSRFNYNVRRGSTAPDLFEELANLSPADEVKYVLGQANVSMDEQGNIRVNDQYDYNFYGDFENDRVLTPEEFENSDISLLDALKKSWKNKEDMMSFAENVGFLLGARDYADDTRDTGRSVLLDLGNINKPLEVRPTSKSRKKPVIAETIKEQFSSVRPKARPEGLASKTTQTKQTPEETKEIANFFKTLETKGEDKELFGEVSEYLDELPERELAPETSVRPQARPKDETAELFGEVSEYLDKLPERKLSPETSVRPQARPTRTVETPAAEPDSVDTDSMSFGDAFKYYADNTDQDVFEWRGNKYKAERKFAEGGTVENQMDNLYNEGGLAEKATGGNPILNHHKNNLKNNPVFNDDGTVSTVRTIIVGDGKYEYLIPTVWDGKILSEEDAFKRAMESGIRWPQAPSGEEGVRALERLDEKLHESISTEYNKGGVVEKQMNRLYQEGGLADDGARVEPVTGNEVPPGSLSEEVRDNVDAKLSEGEYVVPADVVRYYGVRFFEDLRAKAKEDFSKMESEGRIGGEPVDAQGVPMEDDELTPEEMQMLAEALGQAPQGMAMGGMVQQQPIPAYNPYAQQQMQYNNPNTPMPVGMAEGGEVKAPEFNPSQYQLYPSGNQMGAGSGGGIEIVDYINVETGQIRPVTLMNGQPMGLIPEGFVRATPENRKQAMENAGMSSEQMGEKTAEEVLDVRDDSESEQRRMELSQDQANRGSQYKSWAEKNIEKIDENPEEFVKELLSPSIEGKVVKGLSKAAIGMGGIAGLGLGIAGAAFSELNPLAKARAVREDLKARGIDTTTVDGYIKSYVDELPNALDAIDESWASGKGFLSGITDVRSSMGSTTSKPTSESTDRLKKIALTGGEGETDFSGGKVKVKDDPTTGGTVTTYTPDNEDNDEDENAYGASVRGGSAAPVSSQRPQGRRMAEGGFVAKPSKYKSKVTRKKEKKRRGLGSK